MAPKLCHFCHSLGIIFFEVCFFYPYYCTLVLLENFMALVFKHVFFHFDLDDAPNILINYLQLYFSFVTGPRFLCTPPITHSIAWVISSKYSARGSTSCSSHLIFILATNLCIMFPISQVQLVSPLLGFAPRTSLSPSKCATNWAIQVGLGMQSLDLLKVSCTFLEC